MRLTVVGCSGSFPGPESPASCYLVEAEHEGRTWRIVLDLGSGAFGDLQRYADPLCIDAVLLSHLHPDHCLDLTGFYVALKYHPDGKLPPTPVWGPPGTADRMARAYDLPPDPGMHEEFEFLTYGGDPFDIGPFRVEAIPVAHPVPAFGLRVTADGRTVGYSGDTGPCAGLDAVAEGVDLLLAEASFTTRRVNPPGLHLTGADCGTAATQGSAARLVVTHVPPWNDPQEAVDEARTTYDGSIELARPGAVFELGPTASTT